MLRQLAPPVRERNEMIADSDALEAGMTTMPSGRTTGWPPRPVAALPVLNTGPHVRPPSADVVTLRRSPALASSKVV